MEEQYLINGLQNRNKVVFDFIFHYYYSGLCAYCERITKSQQIAEDIVQDLFVTLWIKHEQIQISSSLKNYLFTAVKNRSLDHLRQEQKKAQKLSIQHEKEELPVNLSSGWFAESELNSIIEESMAKLPPRCREIFKMSRFEDLKNQEIADKLGLSKRTVELQISTALKQLRNDLKNYLPLFLLVSLLK
ncbi:RNA polymerase sigma-70 factor, ECF subfamily [Mariniphaga anaerophila]|uniref:RNA polymerase sigma-70 factor, ECF subfamily n=1 Tax=Mariniphaga anaerophila TaxID=1484053 RepID=A0A1M5BI95_9BACT|nr:RNA polymerase sigma-70 factor [Mariniphaga anaerophila]SHF42070.1 RNA polymerase sigma-70 factor, ECF subfamily [Mariniphaga anaerophila]